jgi:hypothetical protein
MQRHRSVLIASRDATCSETVQKNRVCGCESSDFGHGAANRDDFLGGEFAAPQDLSSRSPEFFSRYATEDWR